MTPENSKNEGVKCFDALFAAMTEGVAIHEMLFDASGNPVDYRIVEVNRAFEMHTGIPAIKACGRTARDLYGTTEPPFLELYWEVARTGQPNAFETHFAGLDRHFSVSVYSPKTNWFVAVFSDLTHRNALDDEIRRLTRIYGVLSQINQVVVRIHSKEELLAQVCDIAVRFGEFALAWIGSFEPNTRRIVPIASAGAVRYLKEIKVYGDDRPEGCGPTGLAFRTGKTQVCRDFGGDPNTDPWKAAASRFGFASAISLPIRENGKVSAVFVVYAREKGFFRKKDVKLLEEVAGDISFALDHLAQNALRQRAEEAQAQSLSLLRATLESTGDGILVVDLEGRIVDYNQQFVRMWRLPKDAPFLKIKNGSPIERSGRAVMEHVFGDLIDPENFMARVQALSAMPEESAFDTVQFKDGRVFERYSIPQRVNGGPVGRVWTFSDVSERIKAEESLRKSERQHRLLIDHLHCGVVVHAPDTRILMSNPEASRLLGLTADQLSGKTAMDPAWRFLRENNTPMPLEDYPVKRVVATGCALSDYVLGIECKAHAPVTWVLVNAYPEFDGENALRQVVVTFMDITARKQAELHLRQLSRAVEQSPSGVMITDTRGRIEYVNPKFASMTGYSAEEVLGKQPSIFKSGLTTAQVYEELWRTILAGKEWRGELHNKRKNGELFWEATSICPIADETGAVTNYLALGEDVTERKLLNERLLRAQRMESIGSLAGGVAHDLNNILAPIMMSSSMLEDSLPPEVQRQFITTIQEAAQRGADIIRQLLTFARGVEGQRTTFAPALLLNQLDRMLRETFPKSIAFAASADEGLWTVTGDLTQLHQVLLNLCVNARDAMTTGGTLSISVQNCELDDSVALPGAKPGRYVRFDVTDSGCGISPEILEKIFDPFFTTKEPGKGTGLGLSTALGIVHSHSGFMQVQTVVGNGSTFQVFLPATQNLVPAPSEIELLPLPSGNGELILIVDDEPEILKVLRALLLHSNYRVLTAQNGAEGLAVYQANPGVDLVFTDLMMPVMDGIQFARVLKNANPSVKIIATSGYGEDAQHNELKAVGVEVLLKKPFNPSQVLRAIHNALR